MIMLSKDKKRAAIEALVTNLLEREGMTSSSQRCAAFEYTGLSDPLQILINKVALEPTRVTDEDIAVVKMAGLSEAEIFQLIRQNQLVFHQRA